MAFYKLTTLIIIILIILIITLIITLFRILYSMSVFLLVGNFRARVRVRLRKIPICVRKRQKMISKRSSVFAWGAGPTYKTKKEN